MGNCAIQGCPDTWIFSSPGTEEGRGAAHCWAGQQVTATLDRVCGPGGGGRDEEGPALASLGPPPSAQLCEPRSPCAAHPPSHLIPGGGPGTPEEAATLAAGPVALGLWAACPVGHTSLSCLERWSRAPGCAGVTAASSCGDLGCPGTWTGAGLAGRGRRNPDKRIVAGHSGATGLLQGSGICRPSAGWDELGWAGHSCPGPAIASHPHGLAQATHLLGGGVEGQASLA